MEEGRLKLSDLLDAAQDAGFRVSDRLVDDWVKVGLLDRPDRRGLGRGKGTEATWPETQLKLFIAILDRKRAGDVKRQATLCNIPVFMWLNFGDAYVPLRQVRRALETWIGAHHRGSMRAARYSARQVVEQFQHPASTKADRRALVEEIAVAGFRGRIDTEHRDVLLDLLRRVNDPHGIGRGYGPGDPTPDLWLATVEAQLAATKHYQELSDEEFVRARAVHLAAIGQWESRSTSLAVPERARRELAHDRLEERANRACQDLLLGLGMQVLAKQGTTVN